MRLNIELLAANHAPVQQELAVKTANTTSTPQGKATGTAGAASLDTFSLPDQVVLPVRLSSLAITLHSLRNLAR